jgi:photoactive yellow protein
MATIATKAGPWNMTVFSYEDGDADNPIGRFSPDEVGQFPFGAVELDRCGKVLGYNDTEPDDGGAPRLNMTGRDFFEVLKLAGSPIAEEFRKGVDGGDLNVVFDCGVNRLDYKVRVHLKVSPILGTYWAFIKKLRRRAAA